MTNADVDRSDLEVGHDADAHRYVLRRGEQAVGTLAYRTVGRPGPDTVDVYSTTIDPSCRGQGLGEVLVRGALDDLRRKGAAVKASCWFVADFLDANPDYQDLREAADRPVATGNVPAERTGPEHAHEAHERGMSDTDPSDGAAAGGGDPGRPPTGG